MWDEGRLEYGTDERQAVDLTIPPIGAKAANGLAVLVHGAQSGAGGSSKAMEPLGVNLMAHGWVVANVDYLGESAKDDVASAFEEARGWWTEVGGEGPLVAVGHLDGASYALGAAQDGDLVVALDPQLGAGEPTTSAKAVCLVTGPESEADAKDRLSAAGATLDAMESRDFSRGLAIDPMAPHWPEVAKWIHDTTGARSDPLGNKQ